MKRLLLANGDRYTLMLRLVLGLTLFLHGAQKALGVFGGVGWGPTVIEMGQGGIPGVVAHLVIIGEFFGGLALMAGFLTRIAAAGNVIIMGGAVFLVHWSGGFFAKNRGFEFPLLLLVLSVYFMIRGAGRYSVDALLFGQDHE